MRVKKFVARTLTEALTQIRTELGPDAVILHSHPVRSGGFMGLFATRMIEVTAAAEQVTVRSQPLSAVAIGAAAPALPLAGAAASASPGGRAAPALRLSPPASPPPSAAAAAVAATAAATAAGSPGVAVPVSPDRDVSRDLDLVKEMLTRVLQQVDNPPRSRLRLDAELKGVLQTLIQVGIEEDLAVRLIKRVKAVVAKGGLGSGYGLRCASRLIRRDLDNVSTMDLNTGERRIAALIGPTGVGKTTTVAKLAAHASLGHGKRVGLITADTYRVAAVEQLRTYSEILKVPLEVVYDPSEIPAALERLNRCDLVLVDTAGRSPRNSGHMAELKRYLDQIGPDETYLVMSLTVAWRDAVMIADSYRQVDFNRFICTKLDETTQLGMLYNLAVRYQKSLSYVTTGQNVPDDIEMADPSRLCRDLLGE